MHFYQHRESDSLNQSAAVSLPSIHSLLNTFAPNHDSTNERQHEGYNNHSWPHQYDKDDDFEPIEPANLVAYGTNFTRTNDVSQTRHLPSISSFDRFGPIASSYRSTSSSGVPGQGSYHITKSASSKPPESSESMLSANMEPKSASASNPKSKSSTKPKSSLAAERILASGPSAKPKSALASHTSTPQNSLVQAPSQTSKSKALLALAEVIFDHQPFGASRGETAQVWKECLKKLHADGHFLTLNSQPNTTLKKKVLELIKWHQDGVVDGEDNDLQKISQSSIDSIERELTEKDKIKLGALLDKIISDRNEVLNKSDAERAKKKEKDKYDKEGGEFIRAQAMQGMMKKEIEPFHHSPELEPCSSHIPIHNHYPHPKSQSPVPGPPTMSPTCNYEYRSSPPTFGPFDSDEDSFLTKFNHTSNAKLNVSSQPRTPKSNSHNHDEIAHDTPSPSHISISSSSSSPIKPVKTELHAPSMSKNSKKNKRTHDVRSPGRRHKRPRISDVSANPVLAEFVQQYKENAERQRIRDEKDEQMQKELVNTLKENTSATLALVREFLQRK
ncbi:hypothetical protein F5879DRAFT_1005150 [Lentinula edodes]|nr:hypothetical protein F5879DRAFT_1005150 [Lentinula edodes]